MTCERMTDLFSACLEGELGAAERRAFEAHLEACPDCAALFAAVGDVRSSLAAVPELEPPADLLRRLRIAPERKRRLRFVPDFLLRPSLQPVFAAGTLFLVVASFLFFAPQGRTTRKAIDLKLHQGFSQVEKIYARAGSLTDRLGEYKASVLDSLRSSPLLGNRAKDPS